MRPTEILVQEHRVIRGVLDCLEQMIQIASNERKLDVQAARDVIDFFRHFADGCHHAKEENQLFPAMERKGFGTDTGPIPVMLHEHAVGRDAVRGMEEAVTRYEAGDMSALSHFAQHGWRYLNLLRQHIEKEDHCLFNMADQAFSEDEQAELLDLFAEAERAVTGAATKEKYLRMAQRLGEQFHVSIDDTMAMLLAH